MNGKKFLVLAVMFALVGLTQAPKAMAKTTTTVATPMPVVKTLSSIKLPQPKTSVITSILKNPNTWILGARILLWVGTSLSTPTP